jgi:hypothetical protein
MTDHRGFQLRRLVGSPGAGRDPVVLGHQPPVRLAGGGQVLLTLLQGALWLSDHVGVQDYAAFPSEWPRRLILGWSPQLVLTDHEALLS